MASVDSILKTIFNLLKFYKIVTRWNINHMIITWWGQWQQAQSKKYDNPSKSTVLLCLLLVHAKHLELYLYKCICVHIILSNLASKSTISK